ncbi:MAG: glycosyltransferase, partial [Flavobacteriales bacterium]|nr:glycosyltransferase [Flavobacteriales bacterium]
MKCAIVILNWNGVKYLEQFLPSVVQHSSHQIIVADNDSSDDSVSFLKKNYPDIQIIQLDQNYGFAEGYNQALKQIDSEYYVLLNSDIEVSENWLENCLVYLDENKEVAACQPKILSFHEKAFFEYAGACGGYLDFLGYPFCRGRIFDHTEEDQGQYDQEA